MKASRYIIRHGEEGSCPECGYPLDEGDVAYEIVDKDGVSFESCFCSPVCAGWSIDRLGKNTYVR